MTKQPLETAGLPGFESLTSGTSGRDVTMVALGLASGFLCWRLNFEDCISPNFPHEMLTSVQMFYRCYAEEKEKHKHKDNV